MIDLFRHNFDVDTDRAAHGEATAAARARTEAQARLEEARQQGFDAGRALGRQEAQAEHAQADAARLAEAHDSISAQLASLGAVDAALAQTAERDIVDMFLGVADRLLPELLATHGADLAAARIRKSVAEARTDPVLKIHASPEVIAVLESETPDWVGTGPTRIELVPDVQAAPHTAQVFWQGGHLEYDLDQACTAIRDALHKAAHDFKQATQKAG